MAANQPQNFSFIPFEDEVVEAKFKTWMRQVLQEKLQKQEPELPDIISIQEASVVTGLAVNTIYERIRKGTIHHLPKNGGKHWRFSRTALIKGQMEEQTIKLDKKGRRGRLTK